MNARYTHQFISSLTQPLTHSLAHSARCRCSQYNRGLDKVGGALLFKLLLDFYHTIVAATSTATTPTALSSATMGSSSNSSSNSTSDVNYPSLSPPSTRYDSNTNVCNTMESPRKLVRQSSKKKARFKDSGTYYGQCLLACLLYSDNLFCDYCDNSCTISISFHVMSSHTFSSHLTMYAERAHRIAIQMKWTESIPSLVQSSSSSSI